MFWNRIRQIIYAALTAIGLVWTNYYLVEFTITSRGELTLANFLNFDLGLFIEQVGANPASSFIGVDVTIAAFMWNYTNCGRRTTAKNEVVGSLHCRYLLSILWFWISVVFVHARTQADRNARSSRR